MSPAAMALPHGYDTPHEYFKHTLAFLRQYSWIYKEANTCYLKANILEQMPQEFQEYFQEVDNQQLNHFPIVHQRLENINKPEVDKFRHILARLIPAEAFKEPAECKTHVKMSNFKKMNMKKQHEILRLANVVHQQLMLHDDSKGKYCLVDFGCGLGYLSEYLYRLNESYLILGLESDLYRIEAAEKRLKLYMPQAAQAIHYRQEFVTESSQHFISKSVQELFQSNYNETKATTATTATTQATDTLVPLDTDTQGHGSTKMAIIGLHACADLTVTSMKLFLQMPQVRHLIIMPCCYHKLQMCEATLKFHNFPLSQRLKAEVLSAEENDSINNYVTYLNRPFLRLACQQTLKRWHKCSQQQHESHGREMFLRAVAETLKQETEVVVKGKAIIDLRHSPNVREFETFTRLYQLKSKLDDSSVLWSENHRIQFYKLMDKYPNGEKLAEALTCLQTAMQKLCENLVLFDRLCYMQEAASELQLKLNVRYEKLMDEELSPRCYVLIVEKL